jgi:hypothetical protein
MSNYDYRERTPQEKAEDKARHDKRIEEENKVFEYKDLILEWDNINEDGIAEFKKILEFKKRENQVGDYYTDVQITDLAEQDIIADRRKFRQELNIENIEHSLIGLRNKTSQIQTLMVTTSGVLDLFHYEFEHINDALKNMR